MKMMSSLKLKRHFGLRILWNIIQTLPKRVKLTWTLWVLITRRWLDGNLYQIQKRKRRVWVCGPWSRITLVKILQRSAYQCTSMSLSHLCSDVLRMWSILTSWTGQQNMERGWDYHFSLYTGWCGWLGPCDEIRALLLVDLHCLSRSVELTEIFCMQGNSLMRLLYIGAFAVSGYSSTEGRTCKPFNPLLGETYEADYPDKGLKFFSEKVRQHCYRTFCANILW